VRIKVRITTAKIGQNNAKKRRPVRKFPPQKDFQEWE
jgi:hypothetical protein